MNTISLDEIVDFEQYDKSHPEHANVIPAHVFADVVVDYYDGNLSRRGLPLPWSKTHGKVSIRPGEVSVWAGINGSGKSLLLNQIIMQAMRNNETACIASMEMKPHVTMARMTRQACGAIPREHYTRLFHQWLEGRLWLYDQQGVVDSKRILSVMRYCQQGLMQNGKPVRIKHFVIDSLMKCGIDSDDYNRQKRFIDEICAHARDFGVHVHLVAHERKGESSRKIGDKFSIKGASEIADQVDNVFIVWRNKDKEENAQVEFPDDDLQQQPDCVIRCDKQRHGEWEGKIALWYDKDSQQYVAYQNAPYIDFMGSGEKS
jgi:twinkle protein